MLSSKIFTYALNYNCFIPTHLLSSFRIKLSSVSSALNSPTKEYHRFSFSFHFCLPIKFLKFNVYNKDRMSGKYKRQRSNVKWLWGINNEEVGYPLLMEVCWDKTSTYLSHCHSWDQKYECNYYPIIINQSLTRIYKTNFLTGMIDLQWPFNWY